MVEVPPARVPDEPCAMVPHGGICEGGRRVEPASLPQSAKNMRAQKIEALKRAFEVFLADGDTSALVEVIRSNRCRPPKNASYPAHHRICDFHHQSTGYRVTRLVADESEQIFIEPTEFADPSQAGVPYDLQGPQLRRWIDDAAGKSAQEMESGEVDWGHYLKIDRSHQNQGVEQAAASDGDKASMESGLPSRRRVRSNVQ